MSNRVTTPRRLLLLTVAAVLAATWFTWLRPTALGGAVSYVVVDGSSMEPTYEDGDLVLVRKQGAYAPGQVIAFRVGGVFDDPTRIIHRIVGHARGEGFVTQGDNREIPDPWQPTDDDIIGRATLHIPMAGDAASFLSRPETFAALGGTAAIVGGGRRRRRRRRRAAAATPAPLTARSSTVKHLDTSSVEAEPLRHAGRWERRSHPRWAFVGLAASTLLAVPILAMAWSALRAPDTVDRTEVVGSIDYAINLDYRFSGPRSAVYPDGTATAARNVAGALVASDPLYSRLLTDLEVTVGYRTTQVGVDRVSSSAAVDVHVETPTGWSTDLETVEPEAFKGSREDTIRVDLTSVARRVAAVAELTGEAGDSYTITVRPEMTVRGTADGTTIEDVLTAPMTFVVKGNLITANALEASESRQITTTNTEPAKYAVGPYELRTQPARAVLSGLALVLVAGIVWFASVLFGGVGLGEPAKIAARYRSQIVDVAVATAPPGPVVMVSGIDELSRIARVEQTVILHEDLGDGAHRYRVFLGSVTYEYEAAPEHPGAAAEIVVDEDNVDESAG